MDKFVNELLSFLKNLNTFVYIFKLLHVIFMRSSKGTINEFQFDFATLGRTLVVVITTIKLGLCKKAIGHIYFIVLLCPSMVE